jgi:molecular chaperone IbpA
MATPYSNSTNKDWHRDPTKHQWEMPPKLPTVQTVQTITLPSLFSDQFFLGFHDQLQRWAPLAQNKKPQSFPPYNLLKIDDNNYKVELAVAGYTKEDIDITVEKDILTVKSKVKEITTSTEVIHQGIAERQWSQQFILGEYMAVKDASLKDGLLIINVERELPEELKPKTIKIK